jgi:hypothetical protein
MGGNYPQAKSCPPTSQELNQRRRLAAVDNPPKKSPVMASPRPRSWASWASCGVKPKPKVSDDEYVRRQPAAAGTSSALVCSVTSLGRERSAEVSAVAVALGFIRSWLDDTGAAMVRLLACGTTGTARGGILRLGCEKQDCEASRTRLVFVTKQEIQENPQQKSVFLFVGVRNRSGELGGGRGLRKSELRVALQWPSTKPTDRLTQIKKQNTQKRLHAEQRGDTQRLQRG